MRYLLSFFMILLIVATACRQPEGSSNDLLSRTDSYAEELHITRLQKDSSFRNDQASPIPVDERASFTGLHYFLPDTNFRVKAMLTIFEHPDTFQMPTTTDRSPLYARYGKISFTIQGNPLELEVYRNLELAGIEGYEDYLFIPFRDATSAHGSYGGGRYLDIHASEPGEVIIDFNNAYNPYCAYNPRYSCPIPPTVNTLDIRVLAGERSYSDH